MNLTGVTALVTGGGGGLGGAVARRLAAAGSHVVLMDLPETRTMSELAASLGNQAQAVHGDVTVESDVKTAVAIAQERNPFRIAVTCHGGPRAAGRIVDRDGVPYSAERFRRVLDAYLVGTFNVLRLASAAIATTPVVDKDTRGVVINTASIAAFEGQVGQVAYAAAKSGIVGLTLPAARDLAAVGIRVVSIAPGVMATTAFGNRREQVEAAWRSVVPFPRRLGRSEEFAELVMQICQNDYLNGEVVRLDGALRFPAKPPQYGK